MRDSDNRLRPIVIPAGTGPVHQREIQRQLARLELTDALTLGESLIEAEPRLGRDTTLIVIVQTADPQTVSTLQGMVRRGWSVAIVVNAYDPEDYARVAGPFIAINVPVMQLADEQQLGDVCRQMVMR